MWLCPFLDCLFHEMSVSMGACMERSLLAGVCISLPSPTQLAEEDIASQSITASSKLLYSDRLCSLVCSHEAMHPAPMGMSQEGKKDGAGGKQSGEEESRKEEERGCPLLSMTFQGTVRFLGLSRCFHHSLPWVCGEGSQTRKQ